MNRASRRRTKPRTPTILEVRSAFLLIDQMFDELHKGEISVVSVDGAPEYAVFRDINDDLLPVAPSLDGWIGCWERLGQDMHFSIDQAPLRRLLTVLDTPDGILSTEELAAATAVVNAQRRVYRTLDVYQIRATTNTERIKIALEAQAA
ncbi:hypothetical protein R6242_14195 [Iodobacter sp. CM08]|uniref:hypothetical protein n=1 Tax=Iodobacter sp. CM08 TaxID=3085902 RepID=UPI00298121D6|nr:hypothetical protein [Iodobacter sp. CM08]MDW5417717.1 hypothetical protein [Iodobacter sp. CM08]